LASPSTHPYRTGKVSPGGKGSFVQPLLQSKSDKYYTTIVCIFSLMYPACNAYAPYYHLWPARLYKIFPHYLI